MYLTLTQIRIKYVVLVRPHVLVRISQSNTRSNTVQIHQIRTVLHRISTFRLLLLGNTSDDSVPPLYMSTDTREYCINMPYSSTCQIRIKYTSNTHQIQANMGVLGARPRWAEYMSNTHQIRNQIHANSCICPLAQHRAPRIKCGVKLT